MPRTAQVAVHASAHGIQFELYGAAGYVDALGDHVFYKVVQDIQRVDFLPAAPLGQYLRYSIDPPKASQMFGDAVIDGIFPSQDTYAHPAVALERYLLPETFQQISDRARAGAR